MARNRPIRRNNPPNPNPAQFHQRHTLWPFPFVGTFFGLAYALVAMLLPYWLEFENSGYAGLWTLCWDSNSSASECCWPLLAAHCELPSYLVDESQFQLVQCFLGLALICLLLAFGLQCAIQFGQQHALFPLRTLHSILMIESSAFFLLGLHYLFSGVLLQGDSANVAYSTAPALAIIATVLVIASTVFFLADHLLFLLEYRSWVREQPNPPIKAKRPKCQRCFGRKSRAIIRGNPLM